MTKRLNDNNEIPIIGLGTWKLQGNECYETVFKAIETGYRHIDTADAYHNHQEIAKAILSSKINRSDLFITSKVKDCDLHKQDLIDACHRHLDELNTEYLDLYLIHWPNKNIPITETLEALQQLREEGYINSIGVSNFTISHLKEVLKVEKKIAINQVEFHPSLNQQDLKIFCEKNRIYITAYSPMAQGHDPNIPEIVNISNKYNIQPQELIINWIVNRNMIVIPRSSKVNHLQRNFDAINLTIKDEDLEIMDKLNSNCRTVNPAKAEFNKK